MRTPLARSARGSAALAALAVAATGCQGPLPSFSPVSREGEAVNDLFLLAMGLSALVLLGVCAVLAAAIVRFRERPGGPSPSQTAGNRRLEIAWTAGPTLLVALLFGLSLRTMAMVDAPATDALRVRVIGHQWWWEYQYPDLGVVTANELVLPVGQPVHLDLESADVVHSFWLPRFGRKQDAVPGRVNSMWLRLTQPGTFDGTCTEYCGTQHGWMRLRATGESREQFNAWVGQQRQAHAGGGPGADVFARNTCVNCHAIRGSTAQGNVGPDLTHLGLRTTLGAGVIENTPDNLIRWVRDAQAIKPGVLMPAFSNLSDQDLTALAAYLEEGR